MLTVAIMFPTLYCCPTRSTGCPYGFNKGRPQQGKLNAVLPAHTFQLLLFQVIPSTDYQIAGNIGIQRKIDNLSSSLLLSNIMLAFKADQFHVFFSHSCLARWLFTNKRDPYCPIMTRPDFRTESSYYNTTVPPNVQPTKQWRQDGGTVEKRP